ncbi:MAG: tetratricopeptide repeat protein [Halobacteriota archaeon]
MGLFDRFKQQPPQKVASEEEKLEAKEWVDKGRALSTCGLAIDRKTALSNRQRYKDAKKCGNKAVELDLQNADAWDLLGQCEAGLGNTYPAEKYYNKALEIDPQNARMLHNRCMNLFLRSMQDRYSSSYRQTAIDCFDKALEIYPQDVHLWDSKGTTLANYGSYTESIDCFDKALEIDPQDARAWSNKAASLGYLKRDEEAIECFDKALEIDPNDFLSIDGKKLAQAAAAARAR